MSALAMPAPRNATHPLLADMQRSQSGFLSLGLLMLIATVPTLFAMAVDQRLFLGVNVWDKPLKFEFALAVYLLTLSFYARWLPAGTSSKRWYRIYAGAVVVAIVGEMIWIAGAAGMATSSHFNETPTGAVIYAFMGASAVLLTSASAVYAVQIGRNTNTGLPPVLKEALVVGLGLVLPLTLMTAGTMSSMGSHLVGGAQSDAGGLALMGWARDGGDLRVAHFFATHALHIVPAFGLISMALFGADKVMPLRLATVLYVAFVIFAFVQALSGQAFLPILG